MSSRNRLSRPFPSPVTLAKATCVFLALIGVGHALAQDAPVPSVQPANQQFAQSPNLDYSGKVIEYRYDQAGNRTFISVRKPRIVAVPLNGIAVIPLEP